MNQTQQHEQQAQDNGHGQVHETTIIVNAQPKTWSEKQITFEQVVSLAYDGNPPSGPNWEFTVTYRRGEGPKPQGSLVAGQSVSVKKDMVFDVDATDRS
jgi:hypothetical protein